MDARQLAERNLLFKCILGSRAYGMATSSSDTDIRGVFAAEPLNVLSPFFRVDSVEEKTPDDLVFWELSRYAKLLCEQNPSVLEPLWVEGDSILFEDPVWSMLRDIRGELLTRKLRSTYLGYAKQQLSRMTAHARWMENPLPEEPPRPSDFMGVIHNAGLPPEFGDRIPLDGNWTAAECGNDTYLLFPGGTGTWFDSRGNIRAFSQGEVARQTDRPMAAILKFNQAGYQEKKRDHANYWTWRRNRNGARAEIEERLGYEPKSGSHLIRLLRTAQEVLRDGVIRVRRPDANELLAIRRGEWSHARLTATAAEIEASLPGLASASTLPETIDVPRVAGVVTAMYQRYWENRSGRTVAAAPAGPVERTPPDPLGRVVFVDVEMTGMFTAEPRIVELAAVEVAGGIRTGRVFHSYVNPGAPIHPNAQQIHGLTEEFLAGSPALGAIAPGFTAFIGGSPMVMHDAAGDVSALNHDLGCHGLEPLGIERVYDSQRIARQMFPGMRMSLDALCDVLGVGRTVRSRGHSAIIDATLLADCCIRLARMDGYAGVPDGGMYRRARRRILGEHGRMPLDRDVSVRLSADGGTAIFTLKDGNVVTADVPAFPDTHRLVIHERSGAVLVFPVVPLAGDWMPEMLRRPDNPVGPAVLHCRGGQVEERWFHRGRPVATPALEEAGIPAP